jgi:hypothetical protein
MFLSTNLVEPEGGCGFMQFALNAVVSECFFCLFGTCEFDVWETVHLDNK